jgi:hypothetical protein
MKFSVASAAGVLGFAVLVQAGGELTTAAPITAAPMVSCECQEVVQWETETVTITVAPGYVTPTSCAIATVMPTDCTSCGYTVVGTLPQYVATEICTTVTCDDGYVIPTTISTGSTCMVNTMCTVDQWGKTASLDPTTVT